jgi:lipopolysaccharide assembly outer membrane protein LptD (OstA)
MGLKLELFLVLLIAFTSVLTMSMKLSSQNHKPKMATKELEFTDTTFTEVTTEGREGVAYGVHGVRKKGVLVVDKLRYHNESIDLLLADKGTYKKDKIYLDGNVSLHQKEGLIYHTEHAYYEKPTAILYATSPFVATMGENVLHGRTMAYHSRSKILYATKVDALLDTAEK